MRHVEVLIIGAGAAGMAAALAAEENGYKNILIAERKSEAGGVLLQCTHHGFGLGFFGEDMTGMEYARSFRDKISLSCARLLTSTAVLKVYPDKSALISGPEGAEQISFDICVFATGCRERTIYSLCTAGTRPAGVMTCGMAQKLMNVDKLDIGDDILILGTGDVGQIIARQLIEQGKTVIAMVEKEARPGGLKRNQEQCIKAYSIPVMTRSTIVRIEGQRAVTGAVVRHLDTREEELIRCSMILTALGMIPEMDLAGDIMKDGSLPEWALAAGNCDYVHDIVDSVTLDALNLFRRA